MIPDHVLRKMRAALLVAGAAGCTRAGSSLDAGARDGTEGGARNDDDAAARANGGGGDDGADAAAEAGTNDPGVADAAVDGAVIACPFHPEGHVVLGDGGVQQAKAEPGLSHIGLGNINRDPCPGCGMGGPLPGWKTPGTVEQVGEIQTGEVGGVNETQANLVRRMMAALRAGIRQCYRQGLLINPSQAGRMIATITWGPSGEVKTVTTNSSGSNLEAPTLNCIARRIRNAGPVTELGGATATVKLTFTTDK